MVWSCYPPDVCLCSWGRGWSDTLESMPTWLTGRPWEEPCPSCRISTRSRTLGEIQTIQIRVFILTDVLHGQVYSIAIFLERLEALRVKECKQESFKQRFISTHILSTGEFKGKETCQSWFPLKDASKTSKWKHAEVIAIFTVQSNYFTCFPRLLLNTACVTVSAHGLSVCVCTPSVWLLNYDINVQHPVNMNETSWDTSSLWNTQLVTSGKWRTTWTLYLMCLWLINM